MHAGNSQPAGVNPTSRAEARGARACDGGGVGSGIGLGVERWTRALRWELSSLRWELARVSSRELGALLFHVPVTGDREADPTGLEPFKRRRKMVVAEVRADREMRQAGERELAAPEHARADGVRREGESRRGPGERRVAHVRAEADVRPHPQIVTDVVAHRIEQARCDVGGRRASEHHRAVHPVARHLELRAKPTT